MCYASMAYRRLHCIPFLSSVRGSDRRTLRAFLGVRGVCSCGGDPSPKETEPGREVVDHISLYGCKRAFNLHLIRVHHAAALPRLQSLR